MPVAPTYPGVYIEEVPSGVRTIVGVSTSVTAFIGFFKRGPMDRPIQIFSMGDFEREFGGLDKRSEASYAIQQFFLNGGSEAWVVRTAEEDTYQVASAVLKDEPGGTDVLGVTAGRRMKGVSVEDPGKWGNSLRIDVDYETSDPAKTFNFTVSETEIQNGRQVVVRTEMFRNLSMVDGDSNDAIAVVNEGSKLVQLSRLGSDRPAQTGTSGGAPDSTALSSITSDEKFKIKYGSVTATATLDFTGTLDIQTARTVVQAAIRAAKPNDPVLAGVVVQVIDGRFRISAGRASSEYAPSIILEFLEDLGSTAANLGLIGTDVSNNVQQYALGSTATTEGKDGKRPDANALTGGNIDDKTGLYALEDVDIFNILCIPRAAALDKTAMSDVVSKAEAYCQDRRAFLLVDIPSKIDTVQEANDWLEQHATLRHRNAAVYFPRPRIADPLNNFRLKSVAPSGTMAGLYARTDAARGVWKAPAGTEAVVRNVQELDYNLTDAENGTLNPLGINCLRNFPVFGNVCWGARTLEGADMQASEWKYIPVRRLALFLEESLYRGTQWVVFEPNDEPLWSQIRLNVGAFMQNLFRQGAFQGQTPRDAYFVKCDGETTIQNDINQGIVNIVVGFAPLKPAEFVIIKIQQITGEIQT